MGHADGHGHQACRGTDDLALAPGVVFGCQRQIAGGGGYGAVVHRNAGACALVGFALDGDAGVAHADGCQACAGLDHAGMDGVVFIGSHIALMGRHGHTAALDRGFTGNGNIAHFVQVEHHVRHIDGHRARRAAAAIQVGIGEFLVVDGQGAACFQRRLVLYVGMHASPVSAFLVVDLGLGLVRHFVLFVVAHAVQDFGQRMAVAAFAGAVEVFGQVAAIIVIYAVRYAVDGVLVTEAYGIAVGIGSIRIHGIRQVIDAVVHRHGQNVHGNAGSTHAHPGHSGFDIPLGLGFDGKLVFSFQYAV